MPSNVCAFRCCVVVLIISITLTQISKTHSTCIQTQCNSNQCPNPTECSHGFTEDDCHCCNVCLKHKGETCGPNIGKCGKNLTCLFDQHLDPVMTNLVISDKQSGICGILNCTGVKCHNIGANDDIKCQNDSYKLLSAGSDSCCQITCACLPAICNTSQMVCPHNMIAQVVRPGDGKPGSCCDLIQCIEAPTKCSHNNRLYLSGDKWKADKCTTCECRDGLTFCQKKDCRPITNCNAMAMSTDECCPTCQGCISSNGKFYNNTHNWYENDCTHCECNNGKIRCKVEMCSPVHCDTPVTVPGYCCPICPPTHSTLSCDLQCSHGYKYNSLGNNICECNACSDTSVKCKMFCPLGFKRGRDGCETCECNTDIKDLNEKSVSKTVETFCTVSNGSLIAHGIYWNDGCRECFCNSGKIMCTKPNCPPLKCSNAIIINHQCCPICADQQNKDNDQNSATIHPNHIQSHLFITAIILTLIITILLLGIFILLAVFIMKKYPHIKHPRSRGMNNSVKENAIIHLWPYSRDAAQVPKAQEKQFISFRVGNKNNNLLNNDSLQIEDLGHSLQDKLLSSCSCPD